MEPGHLEIARAGETIYLRTDGECDERLCPALKDFASHLPEGCHLVFDLADATNLDSTFMGTLLCIHRDQRNTGGEGVTIANASDHCHAQLAILCLDRIMTVVTTPVVFPEVETTTLQARPASAEEHLATIRQAHERLAESEPRNRTQFAHLLATLKAELASEE